MHRLHKPSATPLAAAVAASRSRINICCRIMSYRAAGRVREHAAALPLRDGRSREGQRDTGSEAVGRPEKHQR